MVISRGMPAAGGPLSAQRIVEASCNSHPGFSGGLLEADLYHGRLSLRCTEADGVRSKLEEATDELPDWPQPSGIFVDGTHFNPIAFLKTIRELYEKFVIEGMATEDLGGMEHEAFAKLPAHRTVTGADGRMRFRLFDYLTLTWY